MEYLDIVLFIYKAVVLILSSIVVATIVLIITWKMFNKQVNKHESIILERRNIKEGCIKQSRGEVNEKK